MVMDNDSLLWVIGTLLLVIGSYLSVYKLLGGLLRWIIINNMRQRK